MARGTRCPVVLGEARVAADRERLHGIFSKKVPPGRPYRYLRRSSDARCLVFRFAALLGNDTGSPARQTDRIDDVVTGQQTEDGQRERALSETFHSLRNVRVDEQELDDAVNDSRHEQHGRRDAEMRMRGVEKSLGRGFENRLAQTEHAEQTAGAKTDRQPRDTFPMRERRDRKQDDEEGKNRQRDARANFGQALLSDHAPESPIRSPRDQGQEHQEREERGAGIWHGRVSLTFESSGAGDDETAKRYHRASYGVRLERNVRRSTITKRKRQVARLPASARI